VRTEDQDMSDSTYNGWTNYATWRIQIEMFDGYEDGLNDSELRDVAEKDTYDFSKELEEQADERLSDNATDGSLVLSYARAFLSDVNFYEIAEHIISEAKSRVGDDEEEEPEEEEAENEN
jgi:hypothetical protein